MPTAGKESYHNFSETASDGPLTRHPDFLLRPVEQEVPEDVGDLAEPDQLQDLGVELSEVVAFDVGVQHDQLLLPVRVRVDVVDREDGAVVALRRIARFDRFRQLARQLSSELDDGIAAELVDAAVDGHLLEHLDLRRLGPERQRESKQL